jgi:hypothetical protein
MPKNSNNCERCGYHQVYDAESHRTYVIPDEYDRLCFDCAEEVNTHTAEDMTDGELIAAIMYTGCADPYHAEQHVKQFREGDDPFVWCERATACFEAGPEDYPDQQDRFEDIAPGDLSKLVEAARQRWCSLTGEERERLEAFAESWAEAEQPGEISGVSPMYPSLGF